MQRQLFFCFIFLTSLLEVKAQCMMYPLGLNNRITQASTVVMGNVLQQESYLTSGNRIYTASLVHVKAYLKGSTLSPYIIVLSEGGVLADLAELVDPSLSLDLNHDYVLMLLNDNMNLDNKEWRTRYPNVIQAEAYASAQGSLTYQDGLYHDLLSEKPLSEAALFLKINQLTGLPIISPDGKEYKPRSSKTNPVNQSTAKISAISGVSPNPGISGTIDVANRITITGSGFGASAGTVEYRNANDGGATYIQSSVPTTDIISWSDNQIVMKVPRLAGTHVTGIRVNGTFTSAYTVDYAHIEVNNVFLNYASSTRHRYFLVNKDGSGGYAFQYNTGFAANAPAVASFERALATWRCNTFVNFSINPTTTTTAVVGNDGENVVFFDPTLPAGVLGRATSQFLASGINGTCDMQNTVWYTAGIDIQFQDPPAAGFTWNYGPSASVAFSSTYDFESVAVHELGHAHGLGHIIAAGKVMHYALFNGTDTRTLDPVSDIAGGLAKMNYSTNAANYCVQYPGGVVGPMVALTGPTCALPVELLYFRGEQLNSKENKLEWSTIDELSGTNFYVERSADGLNFDTIALVVSPARYANKQYSYQYRDTSMAYSSKWYYRLMQSDKYNRKTASSIIQLGEEVNQNSIVFFDAHANLVNVRFSIPSEEACQLLIYTIS